MIRKGREVRLPHGIDAELVLVMATDPILQGFSRISNGHLDAVVSATNPHSFGSQTMDQLHALLLNGRVSLASIRVNQDGIGSLQDGLILGPPHGVNGHRNTGHVGETLLEQEAPGVEFMISRAMAGFTCQKNDLLVGSL